MNHESCWYDCFPQIMSTSTGQSKNCEDYLVAMLASQLEKKLFELGMLSDRICGIPPVSHGETNPHPPFCKGQKTHDAPKSPSQSFTENPRFSPVLQNFFTFPGNGSSWPSGTGFGWTVLQFYANKGRNPIAVSFAGNQYVYTLHRHYSFLKIISNDIF